MMTNSMSGAWTDEDFEAAVSSQSVDIYDVSAVLVFLMETKPPPSFPVAVALERMKRALASR
ncbi:hypothetical protein ACVIYH_000079 [Bradyrhizobium diazoefficiens]